MNNELEEGQVSIILFLFGSRHELGNNISGVALEEYVCDGVC